MKSKFIRLFTVVLCSLALASCAQSEKHIGKWSVEERGKTIGYITFESDGYMFYEFDGEVKGGKEDEIKGKKVRTVYTTNYDETPLHIDFYIIENETDIEIEHMPGIMEFSDSGELKIAMSSNDTSIRPTKFEGEDVVILTKVTN